MKESFLDFTEEKRLFPLLNEHLYNLSVNDLKEFIKKPRQRQLNKDFEQQVKGLIKYRQEDNQRFTENVFGEFFDGHLVRLARQKLDTEGKLEIVKLRKDKFKTASVYDLFLAMKSIIDTAERANKLGLIR